MTPIFFNSSSANYSPYPNDFHHEHHLTNQFLSLNSQASSSLNPLTTNMFLNSIDHDQNRIFDSELHSPQHEHKGDIFGSQAYNHQIENSDEKGVQFFTWNKGESINNMNNDQNQVKWMSSKMRVMLKMKKSNPVDLSTYSSTTREVMIRPEDHKLPTSPAEETDDSSNSTSSNNNTPIRVCSDCYTTKTPLWRSGPRGPKSLCNACGIRQRKARRALLAAATSAENGNINVSIDQSIINPLKVTKTRHKDFKKPSNNGYVAKYKKRKYSKNITATSFSPPPPPPPSPSPPSPSPSPSPSSSSPERKNCVEEFLVSLSKNLSFYRVFPQDEKEAAILLMAISCGYAHET